MKRKQIDYVGGILALICICIAVGIVVGAFAIVISENNKMKDYDLYNCIYNNAQLNDFNQNPIMIKKIQNECICFREHNYNNLLDVDCSREAIKTEKADWVGSYDDTHTNISCHSDGCNTICCNNKGTCTTTLMYCSEELMDIKIWGSD